MILIILMIMSVAYPKKRESIRNSFHFWRLLHLLPLSLCVTHFIFVCFGSMIILHQEVCMLRFVSLLTEAKSCDISKTYCEITLALCLPKTHTKDDIFDRCVVFFAIAIVNETNCYYLAKDKKSTKFWHNA